MLSQYLDDSQVYNNPYVLACRIEHDMEPQRVQQTLDYLMQQHDILRTTFRLVDNDVCQCVADDMSFTFSFEDISAFSEEDIEKYVSETAKAKGNIVFDLENGPLVYLHMVKTHQYDYVLFLTFHHIISDGWTVNVFFKMLMENYFRLLQGGTLPIEKTLQFTDYALAEDRWYTEGEYQTGLAYWAKKLDGITGQLDLATDYPRPAKMSTTGESPASSLMRLSASAYKPVRHSIRRHNSTLSSRHTNSCCINTAGSRKSSSAHRLPTEIYLPRKT
nr:condensation domain-containing protein [Pectobacterium carotovorum]